MSKALFSIASIQMMLENYDESEKALKELSTSSSIDHPMTIYPMLLQRQGKNDEAKVQGENMLLSHIIQSTSMLATNLMLSGI
ncbi:hypothetical protein LL037_13325 [Clostridium estertheticum]|uniref:hypothetical protein n=1 Tax=Clostridium estertheticum TaxID=238834 RepID=UPI001C0CCD56|nr:hypothetical protein [Clostridium estertheticum]MBU3201477.1 hypothetical protein [Clostridium estertheticum]WAG63470.1 hypothetical protein LL037_13325 [Clostridium estertheticum]